MLRYFTPVTIDEALSQQQAALLQSSAEINAASAERERVKLLRPGPGRPRVVRTIAELQPPEEIIHQPPAKRTKYENWFTTPFIHDILDAYRKTGHSARKAVTQLQRQFPCRATEATGRYDSLREGTVRAWFDSKKKLLPKYQTILEEHANVDRGRGYAAILSRSPEAEKELRMHLETLRDGGGPVDTIVIRLIAMDVLKRHAPELLKELKLSDSWCKRLAADMMGYSWRTATTAASKLPNDWRDQGVKMAKRIAYNVQLYKIHPSMIVNLDQTGVKLVPSSNKTFAPKGSKDVRVIGHDDKRQITACIASSADGDLLPLQLIFAGKTALSEPKHTESSKAARVHITHSPKHWSNQETMRLWVTEVLLPHADRCRLQHNLPENPHMVLVLDVWSVHISEEFRSWLKENHPHIHLVFVPPLANCTSELQVADVILQKSFKAGIRKEFNKWAAELITEQIRSKQLVGLASHLKMSEIKPLVLDWCITSWSKMLAGRQYIKMGWHTCCVSLFDIWSIEKRVALVEAVLRGEFEANHVPVRPSRKRKAAAAAAAKPEPEPEESDEEIEDRYQSEVSDEDSHSEVDQLDIMKERQYGKRTGRIRTRPVAHGYQLDSSQMELSGDEAEL